MKIEITILILILLSLVACKNDTNNGSGSTQAPETITTQAPSPVVEESTQSGEEEFNTINATILNGRLAMADSKMDVEEVARLLFLPKSPDSKKSDLSITQKKLENGNIEAIVIQENFISERRAAEKFVMVLRLKEDIWQIVSLKKNWRCKEDRKYQIWGTGDCI